MPYKTIILEMLEQRPMLHQQLRFNGELLSAMNQLAMRLRELHLEARDQLRYVRPDSADLQISSEAMEIALQAIEDTLPPETKAPRDDPLSLDEAMRYLRRKD